MDKLNLFEEALPRALFDRLVRAVQAVGTERMEEMGSYSTTFWFPIGAKATNIVEECLGILWDLVRPRLSGFRLARRPQISWRSVLEYCGIWFGPFPSVSERSGG